MPTFVPWREPRSAVVRFVSVALATAASFALMGCAPEQAEPPSDQEAKSPEEPTGPVTYLTFGPDGRTVVAGSYWSECKEPDPTGDHYFHPSVLGGLSTWDVSADRAVLASRGGARVFMSGRGTSLEIPIFKSVTVSPDGRRLAYVVERRGPGGYLGLADTATGGKLPEFWPREGRRVGPFAFSPDGQSLAVCEGKSVRFKGGPQLADLSLEGLTGNIWDITFSPDGRRLACASGDHGRPGEVTVWILATGEQAPGPNGPFNLVRQLVYSPDGQFLAGVCNGATVKVWDAASGREVRTLPGCPDTVYTPGCVEVTFSPDGRLLAGVTDVRTVNVWDVLTGRELGSFSGSSAAVTVMAFDRDGKRLAIGNQYGGVKVWNIH